MLDLQGVVVNDDTLDNQPQDGLALGDAGSFQPGADTFTERGEIRKRLPRFEPPFLDLALVLIMLLRQVTLLGKRPALTGQLLQADHLGLVSLEQPAIGTVQSLNASTQLSTGGISACSVGLAGKTLELRQYLGRILEQADDVGPNCLLQTVRWNLCPRTFCLAPCREWIRTSASVIALSRPPTLRREVATMEPKAASAALEQAAQQVVVFLIATERHGPVARECGTHAIPGLLIDQWRHRDGDPLLRWTETPRAALGTSTRPAPRYAGDHVVEAIGVGGAGVHRIGQDVVHDGRRPLPAARSRHPRAGIQAFRALANGEPLLKHPGIELTDHGCLRLVDDQVCGHDAAARLVAIAVGDLRTEDIAVARFLQLATPEPLSEHGALILRDGALDLQQKLVIWVVRNRVVQKDDLAAGAAELLHEQDLVGILPREPVGADHGHHVNGSVADSVSERVQRGTVQARPAVALITEHMSLGERVPLVVGPVPQGRDLTANGLLSLLALCRDAGIDRSTHGSSPGLGDRVRVSPPRLQARGGTPLLTRGVVDEAAVALVEPIGAIPVANRDRMDQPGRGRDGALSGRDGADPSLEPPEETDDPALSPATAAAVAAARQAEIRTIRRR